MESKFKVGDKVKVKGINKIGVIEEIDLYEDYDGDDEEYGQVIIPHLYHYVRLEDNTIIRVEYNLEKVEE